MTRIDNHKVGLVIGTIFGGGHLIWSILVALNWAGGLINFIFWAHMIKPVIVVENFNITSSLTLIVVTAIIGYIIGNIFAIIWNKIYKS